MSLRALVAAAVAVARCSGNNLRGHALYSASEPALDLRRVALLRSGATVALSIGGDDTVWSELVSSLDGDTAWMVANVSHRGEDGPESGPVVLWSELVQPAGGAVDAMDFTTKAKVSFLRSGDIPGGVVERVITDGSEANASSTNVSRPTLLRQSASRHLQPPIVIEGLDAFQRWRGTNGTKGGRAVYLTGWADGIAEQDWSEHAQQDIAEALRGFDVLIWAEEGFRSEGFTALIPRWLRLGGHRHAVVFTRPEQLEKVEEAWSGFDLDFGDQFAIVSVDAAAVAAALEDKEHALPLPELEALEPEEPPRERRSIAVAGLVGAMLVVSALYEMYCWRPSEPGSVREIAVEAARGHGDSSEGFELSAVPAAAQPAGEATAASQAADVR